MRNLLRWVDNGAQLEVVADVIESVRRSKTTLADETAKEFLGMRKCPLLAGRR